MQEERSKSIHCKFTCRLIDFFCKKQQRQVIELTFKKSIKRCETVNKLNDF